MAKHLLFIFLILFQTVYLEEIPSPIYDGNTLKYLISLNLTKYLEELTKNNSEIENKTIYSNEDDLKGLKTGLIRRTILHNFALRGGNVTNYVLYDDYDQIQRALNNHSIDQFICFKDLISEQIQMLSENLTYIDYDTGLLDSYESVFLSRVEDTNLNQELKTYFSDDDVFSDISNDWIGLDDGLKHINTTIDYPLNNLNIYLVFNYPYAYIENGEYKGYLLDLLYRFSNKYNYSLNIMPVSGYDTVTVVKNKTANVSISFIMKQALSDKTLFTVPVKGMETVSIIRYDNSINSTKWKIPGSIYDFNGDMIGVMNGQENLVKQIFPDSQTYSNSKPNELFNLLLKEDLDSLLIDQLISYFYEKKTTRVTHFNITVANSSYGFSFNKENIRNEFNDFLSNNFDENSLNSLFEEWKNADENKVISQNITNALSSNNKVLDVFFFNIRPMCYKEKLVYKGYELDLLYRFAYNKGYKLNLFPSEEEGTGENRVIIGCQNITLDENHYFSNSIKNSTIVLVLRPDNIRYLLPFKILDENYQVKESNIIEIPVVINGENKTSLCVFPDIYYNDTILMNCTINNIILNDSFNGNIKYEDSKDRIQILYSSIRVDNLIKANEIFNDSTIIEQSDLSKINKEDDDFNYNTNSSNYFRKSNKKLSTGGIIAIIIPCIAVLVIVAIVSILLARRANKNNQTISINETSIKDLKNKNFY